MIIFFIAFRFQPRLCPVSVRADVKPADILNTKTTCRYLAIAGHYSNMQVVYGQITPDYEVPFPEMTVTMVWKRILISNQILQLSI